MDEFIRLKRTNKKAKDNNDKPASGLNNIHVYWEESKEGSDEENTATQHTCTHGNVISMSDSDAEYKRNLTWLSTQHHLEHHAHM